MQLQPYFKYKNSSIEWLGDIPEHWEVARIKQIGEVKARVGWKALKASEYIKEGYFFLSTPNIKKKDIDFTNVNFIPKWRYDESPEIKLQVDDILLTKDGSTLGTVNIIKYLPSEGTVNSSIAILRFNKNYHNLYVFYQIKSSYIQNIVRLKKDGAGVPHLFQKDINLFNIVTPPLKEQTQIANYLTHQTQHLDRKIQLLQQKIDKYQALQKALINQAVCRGLDEKVPMKDSGVEWVGEIPEHWEVKRVKDTFSQNHVGIKMGPFGSALKSDIIVKKGYKVYGQENVIKGNFQKGKKYIKEEDFKRLQNYEIFEDNIAITMMGTIGKAMVVPKIKRGIMDSHLVRIVVNKNLISPKYFEISMNDAQYLKEDIIRRSKGSIMQGLNSSIIKLLTIVLPPLDEQTQITNYLNQKTTQIQQITTNLQTQIATLQELRKTLINDVVTGKLKIPSQHG